MGHRQDCARNPGDRDTIQKLTMSQHIQAMSKHELNSGVISVARPCFLAIKRK
jgi:hypothetical protein